MRFLTCEPNLKKVHDYKDEADQFYDSPVHWLRSHIPSYPRTAKPTHVVLYEPLAKDINEFLVDYKLLYRITNAEVNDNVDPQLVLNEWYALIKQKQLNVDSLLQHVNSRTGKNILVYQRLLSGEENSFNREEFQIHNKLDNGPKLAKLNEDEVFGQDEFATETNLFN